MKIQAHSRVGLGCHPGTPNVYAVLCFHTCSILVHDQSPRRETSWAVNVLGCERLGLKPSGQRTS